MERLLSVLILMAMGGMFLPMACGCYWAEVRKRSSLDTYVCEWPFREKDVGPLQCEPIEDWQQENSVCEATPPPSTMQKGRGPNNQL